MDNLNETNSLIHRTTGLLNFLGGDIDIKRVKDMRFEEVVDCIFKNGGVIDISVSKNYKYLLQC